MEKITTLDALLLKLEETPIPTEELKTYGHAQRHLLPQYHLGSTNIDEIDKDSEFYKVLSYFFDNVMPPLRLLKWSDLDTLRRKKEITTFNGLQFQCNAYHKFMPDIYTSGIQPEGETNITTKFQVATVDDEVQKIQDYCGEATDPRDFYSEDFDMSMNSMYYHSAKAHWITQSIREEGLWAPIQGYTQSPNGTNFTQLMIHPGSVRSGVFEEMEDPTHELLIWDFQDTFPDIPAMSIDDSLNYWKETILNGNTKCNHKNLSVIFTNGTLEYQSDHSNIEFRREVWKHSKKFTELSAGKPLTIYIGYDPRHNNLELYSKQSILDAVKRSVGGGRFVDYTRFTPEIKILDISKIPEYTREYANQSTEFTYSRFLIPYLENYEGFSMFVDDDFIFNKNPMPMFYYLGQDDAVACIKYPQIKHDETKFDGEVNIDYPCKLWSSMMFFNNSHPDCKKLTPEVVNTWTGAQLHQFEWTDKIAPIPEKYVFVEGYDDPEVKWDFSAVHYTRGGPWINGMDTEHINNLEHYNKVKNSLL